MKNDGHLDLDKDKPRLVTTKSVVQDKDGNDKVMEHVSKEDEKIWEIEYQEHSDRVKKYSIFVRCSQITLETAFNPDFLTRFPLFNIGVDTSFGLGVFSHHQVR